MICLKKATFIFVLGMLAISMMLLVLSIPENDVYTDWNYTLKRRTVDNRNYMEYGSKINIDSVYTGRVFDPIQKRIALSTSKMILQSYDVDWTVDIKIQYGRTTQRFLSKILYCDEGCFENGTFFMVILQHGEYSKTKHFDHIKDAVEFYEKELIISLNDFLDQ